MKTSLASEGRMMSALDAEFSEELGYLTQCASRFGVAQGVMRLRALAEIAGALSTEALLGLAIDIVGESQLSARIAKSSPTRQ